MASTPEQTKATAVVKAPSVLWHLPSHLRFWIPAVAMLWLDLWSKHRVFTTLTPDTAVTVWAPVLEFRRSLNDGAVFGSFTGYTSVFIIASALALCFVLFLFLRSSSRHWLLHVCLALILAGAIGNLYDRAFIKADVARITYKSGEEQSFIGKLLSKPDDRPVEIGDWPTGANPRVLDQHSIERVELRRQGVVRDFIRFMPKFPKWVPKLGGKDVWPWVFNVADASLVVGVFLLMIATWFDGKHEKET